MKNFKVTKIKWASYGDLELPYFRAWNKQNRLPKGFWQRIWEYPFVLLNLPQSEPSLDVGGTYPFVLFKHFPKAVSLDIRDLNQLDHPLHKGLWSSGKQVIGDALKMPFKNDEFCYVFSISAIEEMPDPLRALQEMIRVSSERVVLTMDISNKLGVGDEKLKQILDYLGVRLPEFPEDVMSSDNQKQRKYGQKPLTEFSDIRVLGFVIDKCEEVKDCGILIPHSESLLFLKLCISQIRQMANPLVKQKLYIIDDNSQDGSFEKIKELWGKDEDVVAVQIKRDNFKVPDVGKVLDEGLKLIKEQFVAMIDADLFPMSKEWLKFPIHLVEKYNCSSVGTDTCLSLSYMKKLPGKWKNQGNYEPGFALFSNENFTHTNNFYRIARTADAKVVSERAGYNRIYNLPNRFIDKLVNKFFGKYHWFYYDFPQADNGVRANYFIDINKLGPKFCLPIISWLGFTPQDGVFGQNVCNLIMHFALSTRALSISHKEIKDSGDKYYEYAKKLQSGELNERNISQLFDLVKSEQAGRTEVHQKWQEDFEKYFNEYLKGNA